MNAQIVELDKRTRVAGLWLLPGTKLEFNTVGEANTFVFRNGGTIKKATKSVNRVDTNEAASSDDATGDGGGGKSKAASKSRK